MEFRILGPLEVVENGRQLPLGQGRERALLALLLLHPNEVVAAEALVDALWRGEPTATATKSLQVYVSRLRKRLGAAALATQAPGYAVHVGPDSLDSMRFELLVEDARADDASEAAAKLREALALWRGTPLAEFAYEPWAQREVARLEESRLAALEDRIEAELALGRDSALVAELEALVAQHPYRERLRGELMLALYRAGRQSDALAAYRDARRVLDEEFGLEPGEQLRALERRILAQDQTLAAPVETSERPSGLGDRPPTGRRRRRALLGALVAVALLLVAAVAAFALTGSSSESVVASSNSVALIDPQTNRVLDAVPVSDRPTRIAVYGNSVWVLHPDTRTLTHLDRLRREAVGTVGLGGAPSGLAVDGRGVWVTDAHTGAVTLIEPERLRVVGQVETRKGSSPPGNGNGDAGPIGIGLGSIWLASGERTIARIDPESGKVIARIKPVDTGESLGGIAFGADAVWVAGPVQESMVTRIDPRRNAVVARVFVQKFRLNGIALAGGNVWVSDSGNDQVWAIDAFRNEPVGTTKVGGQPLGVAAGAGSVWVANSGDGTVSRIDPVSRQVVAVIPVGASPNGIAATRDGIWVTVD